LILLVRFLWIAILIRAVYSWIDPNPYATNTFKKVLLLVTDPLIVPLRRWIPPVGMVDLSPLVAFFLLQIVERLLQNLRGY